MATSPLRQVLEGQLSQLSTEVERLFDDARTRARRELADQLNQVVRRIRQADSLDELAAALLDGAAPFSAGAAVFQVEAATIHGMRIRGVADDVIEQFPSIEIPLSDAAALAGAVETRDPVVAVTTPAEVSQTLVDLLAHLPDGRVEIFPLVVDDRAPALLYTWGVTQAPALELLAQVAASEWTVPAPPPPPVEQLVSIAPIAPAPAASPAASWESLSPAEQQIHLRAQRFARVQVAEMRLRDAAAVQSGRAQRNLYAAVRPRIDAARLTLRETFFAQCPSMVDYLHVEMVRNLAHDDPDVLGTDYPGPVL